VVRAGQWVAVAAVLAGRDAFVVAPTGSGKTMCFVLPALVQDRCAVIVTPLIALV
jgi:ATP-dependent DNA helicase RecQ